MSAPVFKPHMMPPRFNLIDGQLVEAQRGTLLSWHRYLRLYDEYCRVCQLLETRELIEKSINTRPDREAVPVVHEEPSGLNGQ